jgi:RHS repeat-associated protein
MSPSAHKTEGVNRTQTVRFYCFVSTGKEKDEETGYGYFGARYMDHELMASFISVDRYASKYPFISPYAYCAWNPIVCIDPNGEKIYMLFYTVGNSRGDNMFHAAALTRRSDIMNSTSFNAKNDIVVMRPIQDLALITNEVHNINHDYGERYGKTVEFDVWSHGGLDGPTGTQPTSLHALDSKQMTLEGWSEIGFNWDENASANFYGCRTGKSENRVPSFAQAVSELDNFKDVRVSGQSKKAYPSTSQSRRNETSRYFSKLGILFTKTYMVGCESRRERLSLSPGRETYPMNTFINGEQQ